jgi:hypothetical protein
MRERAQKARRDQLPYEVAKLGAEPGDALRLGVVEH